MKTWITDENGNRCSVEFWGSEEKAREALKTLENCSYCSDCRDCSYCRDCSDCRDCSYCSYCRDCRYCSYCRYCSDCRDCSYCSYCRDCRDKNKTGETDPLKIPVIEDIHKKIYAAVKQPDALDMGNWHTCDSTHCRAGWVVHLAGEEGKKLEKLTSTLFAAQQIYKKSGYQISPCRFFDDNAKAMADMKILSEVE